MPAAASELNNLLQIVGSTVSMLENIWEGTKGSEKYLEMLRVSVDRAAKVTEEIARQIGGTEQKILLHPSLTAGLRNEFPVRPQLKVSRCILVVDDEPMALELSEQILTADGFTVVKAKSGFEALDCFVQEAHRFELVLLDLSMPHMDGEETYKRIRKLAPRVPVLLNTGFIEQSRLEHMMSDGLAGFLRRPYRPDDLLRHVRAILDRQTTAGSSATSNL